MRFNHSAFNSVAIAIAVGLSAWTLRPMFASAEFFTWLPALLGISAVLGVLGVLVALPRLATTAIQVVGMAALLVWLGFRQAPPPESAEASWYEPLILLGGMGTAAVRDSAIPLPTNVGLNWLLLCILALVVVATELLVNALEQPAWSLAPLGVVYGVGAVTLPTELGWPAFVLVAVGYGLILLSTTHLAGTGTGRTRFQASRVLVVVATVGVAVLLAPLLTSLVPLGDKQPWLQAGKNAPIKLTDPSVMLSENLLRPAEQVVLRYSTDSEEPVYLRTVALNLLTTEGAKLKGMNLSSVGLSGDYTAPGREVKTKVRMLLPSEYLPVPFAVDRFDANGNWAHDPDTMSIVATGQDGTEQTAGLEYEATSTVPDPEREELAGATAGAAPSDGDTLTVPSGLDPAVSALTDDVTAQATTDGEKALAIQNFLRSDEFEYSLKAPDEVGLDVISNFLLADRSGYCIHFTAGMITMSRLEGIPARMAIGFTPGKPDGDEWVVTTHNMHSWPELYFEGLGWVPFEPTKSVAGPPEYTDPDAPGSSPSPSVSPSDPAAPSVSPSVPVQPTEEPSPPPTADQDGISGVDPIVWLSLLGALVLLALPFMIRAVLTAWRLRSGQEPPLSAENAWREVRALFLDTGLGWNESSPVLAAEELSSREAGGALDAATATQLVGLAGTVERARYARDGANTSDLGARVKAFRRDFLRTRGRRIRVRALVLPMSLLSSRRRRG